MLQWNKDLSAPFRSIRRAISAGGVDARERMRKSWDASKAQVKVKSLHRRYGDDPHLRI